MKDLIERLKSLRVLLGIDSPETRGWAPAVQQEARRTIDAVADELERLTLRAEREEAELAKCGRENCMGYKTEGVAHWVREERLKQVEAERDALRALLVDARAEVEFWTPDESNATASEADHLNRWYSLRDRIDAAMRGKEQSND